MRGILIIFLLCLSLYGKAATYYIAPSGNNSNSGSLSSPWLTLSYACTRTSSGDIIHAKAGTYTETAASIVPIGVSIEGEGRDNTIMRFNFSGDECIQFVSWSYNTNGNQFIRDLTLDGITLKAYTAILVNYRGNVKIYNCKIINFDSHAVMFEGGGDGNNPSPNAATGNELHDCIIDNCCKVIPPKDGGEGRGAVTVNGQKNCLIYGNTISATKRGEGIDSYLIKGVGGWNEGLKIYNNTLTKTPQTSYGDTRTYDFIIELWHSLGGQEIYNNTITGGSIDISGGGGQTKGSYSYSNWIHDNIIGLDALTSSQNTSGILLETLQNDVIVERNHIKNVANAGIWMPLYPDDNRGVDYTNCTQRNVTIRNNLITGVNYGIAYNSPETDAAGNLAVNTIINLSVYNNTIIASGTSRYGIRIPSQNGGSISLNIKNNIIQNFDSYCIGTPTVSGAIQNNIFYGNGYNTPSQSGAAVSGNMTGNPLLTTDYHLQSGSPAIDAGLNIGLPFSGTAPDIGAFEYVIVEPPPVHTTKGKLLMSSGKLIITKN